MNKNKWIVFAATVVTLIIAAIFIYNSKASGNSAVISANKVTIRYNENPTTGFSWTYKADNQNILREVKSEYISSAVQLLGTGGEHVWVFEPVSDGTVTLTFVYAQNWEGGSVGDTINLTYTVKNGKIQK